MSHLSKGALVVAVLAASLFVGLTTEKASAFEVNIHKNMTDLSLPFLRPGVLEDVADEHGGFADSTDPGKGSRQRWLHVDGCSFDETVQQINSLQQDAVNELVPGAGLDPWSASDHFGLPIHPAQDLYSHSNWVELGFPVADDPATVDQVEGESVSDLVDFSTTFAGQDQLGPWGLPQDHRGAGASHAPSFGVVRGNILLDDMVVAKDPLTVDEKGILHVHDANGSGTRDEGDAFMAELDPGWQMGLVPHPTLAGQPGYFVPGIVNDGRIAEFDYFAVDSGPFLVPILRSAPNYRLLTSGVGDRNHIEDGDVFSNQCDPFVRGANGQVVIPHRVSTCEEGFIDGDDYTCIGRYGSRFALAHGGTGGLNKDSKGEAPTRYPKALALAVLQTKYEWCRFVHKAGGAGSDGVLLALWVKEGASPHPSGTPCTADDGAGPMGVTVSINEVEVLDDKDDNVDEPGELNLSLVLYDSPYTFSRSDKSSTSEPVYVDDDGSSAPSSVPATKLPAPVEMCVHASNPGFRIALHGWDDDDGSNGDFNQDDNSDDAVIGFSATHTPPALGAPPIPHVTTADDSDDLRISYTIARQPDTDGDGLDACGEPFYGTDPALRDTDGDDLGDGIEVNGSNATNPLVADSDADGLKDGREDLNANGALDTGETNPNDRDSDDDLLSDGIEVDGSNPTNPLIADSDGDGLNDGREDINLNGALDAGETNPNNADSDADGLTDGQEIEFGTNPLDADSDDDGLVDGRDVDWIANAIRALPTSAIKSPADGNRSAMLNLLADAEALLRKGKLIAARDKLTTLRKRVDGCGTSPDGNDWIVDCTNQIKIRALVDLLLTNA